MPHLIQTKNCKLCHFDTSDNTSATVSYDLNVSSQLHLMATHGSVSFSRPVNVLTAGIHIMNCILRRLSSGILTQCVLRSAGQCMAAFADINPIALRTARTPWSFGRSECNRVKVIGYTFRGCISTIF